MPASPMSALHIAGNPMAEFLSGQVAMEMLGHVISPNDSPFTKENPLEKLIDEKVDFEGLRKDPKVPLFVSATDARSGDLKLFSGDELSPKAVAASACLPNVFRSVNIDGRDYWDGGFMGNPPLQPLIQNTKADDVMLIQLNPVELKETPKSAPDINNRLKQLGFHSALLTEIRSVEMMNDLVDSGAVLPGMGVRKVHMHRIDGGEDLARMSAASKIFPDWTVSKNLFEQGRKAADQWLKTNFEKLGKESSFRQSPKNSFGVQQPASSNANTPAGNTTPVAMPAPPPTIRKLQKLATMQQHAANGKTK
jgi:NTE family protein